MNDKKTKNKIKQLLKDYPEICTLPFTTAFGASSTTGFDVLNAAMEDCTDTIVNMGNATSMLPASTNNSSCDSELTLVQSSGDTENFSATSQQGTTVGLLTLGCSSSADLTEPDGIIVVVKDDGSSNAVACDRIEQNAKKIYDKYNQHHDITVDGNSSMIIPDENTARIVDELIKNKSKDELLNDLISLRKAIEQSSNSKANQKKLK